MKDVYLAFKRVPNGNCIGAEEGVFSPKWIYDPLVAVAYIQRGWEVYCAPELMRVESADVCLNMERCNGCQSSKSAQSDN